MRQIRMHVIMLFMLAACCANAAAQDAQQAGEMSQRQAAEIARQQLERAYDNLDLLWELGQQNTADYAEAHNAFVLAHRQFPDIEVFPVKMPLRYLRQCVMADIAGALPRPLEECGATTDGANALSQRSFEASQRMLARYYLENFDERARKLSVDLQEAAQKDTDSALGDFVAQVRDIIAYADGLKRDALRVDVVHLIETQHILNDAEILLQVEQMIRQILSSDISFASGKYELADFTEEGKAAIRGFIERLLAIRERYPLQYPGQPLIIKIKTVGYTDQVPVKSAALIKELTANVPPDTIPAKELERLEFLNRRLSEFRAKTINDYARSILEEALRGDAAVRLEAEILGKGEAFPVEGNVSPPYLRKDPRRRMCKISVIFHRQPLPFTPRSMRAGARK